MHVKDTAKNPPRTRTGSPDITRSNPHLSLRWLVLIQQLIDDDFERQDARPLFTVFATYLHFALGSSQVAIHESRMEYAGLGSGHAIASPIDVGILTWRGKRRTNHSTAEVNEGREWRTRRRRHHVKAHVASGSTPRTSLRGSPSHWDHQTQCKTTQN